MCVCVGGGGGGGGGGRGNDTIVLKFRHRTFTGRFVCWSGNICAILVEDTIRKVSVQLF